MYQEVKSPLISALAGATKDVIAIFLPKVYVGFSAEKRLNTQVATVTTASGKVLDANRDSIAIMGEIVDCAIAKTLFAGGDVVALKLATLPTDWIDANGDIITGMTYGELQEARELADAQFSRLWVK